MPTISLPDGSTRQYDDAVTPAQVASDIDLVFQKPQWQLSSMGLNGI